MNNVTMKSVFFFNENRRTDFHEFAKRWHSTTGEGKSVLNIIIQKAGSSLYIEPVGDGKLVGAEFFHRGMDYFRRRQHRTGNTMCSVHAVAPIADCICAPK